MSKVIAAVIRHPELPDTRVTFTKCFAQVEDPETGDMMEEPRVSITSKGASHGVFRVARYGDDLTRGWVREFVADNPKCHLVKFA